MNNIFHHNNMKKAKILIIDDEEDICVYLKSILEKTKNYEVLATNNPKEGVILAKNCCPDLILLDVIMPGMDGTEVAEQLQDDISTRYIPIVFVTVLADREAIKENNGMIGGHPFISKPVLKEELIARIESLLHEASSAQ